MQGYDVAAEMDRLVSSTTGGECESGFLSLEPAKLQPKRHVEFGEAVGNKQPPSIADLNVSVMYMVTGKDEKMFTASLATVVQNFPDALEVVVVVSLARDERIFTDIVKGMDDAADFPIRVVLVGVLSPTDARVLFPLLSAVDHCIGDFVLHLEANAILLQPLTYERVFHFGKPILPFMRFGGHGENMRREVVPRCRSVKRQHFGEAVIACLCIAHLIPH